MTETSVRWFDAESIDDCPWTKSHESNFIRNYWVPMIKNGAAHYTANLETKAGILVVDEHFLPVTINEDNYDSSYVCSPFTHFITYGIVELRELKIPWLEFLLKYFLLAIGGFLRWGKINRVVHVNNWLLSTNLYPALTPTQTNAAVDFLRSKFTSYTIAFRSLNPTTCSPILEALKRRGAKLVATRQVYIFPGTSLDPLKKRERRDIRKDKALIEKFGYEVVPQENIAEDEIRRCLDIYNSLYIDKYSELNPQFTEAWMRLVIQDKAMVVYALKREGRIDGILGYFWIHDVLTTPLFGYDTALPQELGLYRMLSALTLEQAFERGVLDHASSGVAGFKRNRGYRPAVEYSAVVVGHLPWRQRSVWWVMSQLTQKIAVPLLEKYEL